MQWMRHFVDIPNHIQEKSYDGAVHPECGYEGHFRMNCLFCKFRRKESNAKIMFDRGQDQIRGCKFDRWFKEKSLLGEIGI